MLGTILASVLSGGATGLLGMAFQRLFDWLHVRETIKLQQLNHAHELSMRDKDREILTAEWAGRLRVADREATGKENVAADEAFGKSLFKEPERYSFAPKMTKNQQWVMVFLDFCRGIIRPFLTMYLCALTSYVWWQVYNLLSVEDLTNEQVLEIWKLVVGTILYLTTTCILWWFGVRNRQPMPFGKPAS